MKLFSCIVFIVCIGGCGLIGGETSPPATGLYIINVSPDAPALTVNLNSNTIANDYTYGKDSGYFFTFPGTYDLGITTNGTTLASQLLTLSAGKYLSLYLVDSFSRLKALLIEDKYSSDTFSYAKVRFFDFVTNGPSLNASFTENSTDTINNTIDTVTFFGRYFNDQSLSATRTAFTNVPEGNYKLSLYMTDTSILIKDFSSLDLEAGKYYTIFLKGLFDNTNIPIDTGIIRH